jgi:hypothetical protein
MAVKARLALAAQLLIADDTNNSWDDALRAYLALRALTADESISKMADWNSVLGKLNDYLARDCFPPEIRHQRDPSPYDSPSDFNPATWKQQIEPVLQTLRRLGSATN